MPGRAWFFIIGAILLAGTAGGMLFVKDRRRQGIALFAAWLVPGAGHAVLGKWKKGLFFLGLLGGTYFFGLWIVGFRSVSWEDNPFYYVGQIGSGLTILLAQVVFPQKAFPRPDYLSWFDPGLLYICVVGLLNLVIMLNTLEFRLERPVKPPEPAASAASPPPAVEERTGAA